MSFCRDEVGVDFFGFFRIFQPSESPNLLVQLMDLLHAEASQLATLRKHRNVFTWFSLFLFCFRMFLYVWSCTVVTFFFTKTTALPRAQICASELLGEHRDPKAHDKQHAELSTLPWLSCSPPESDHENPAFHGRLWNYHQPAILYHHHHHHL